MPNPNPPRASTQPAPTARLALLLAPLAAGTLAAAALLFSLGQPAFAAPAGVFRNYPGGSGCTTTLQACLNGASAGDTIVVQPGTYTESLTLSTAVSLTGVSSATAILRAPAAQRL